MIEIVENNEIIKIQFGKKSINIEESWDDFYNYITDPIILTKDLKLNDNVKNEKSEEIKSFIENFIAKREKIDNEMINSDN